MKKWIPVILMISVLAGALTGCGAKKDPAYLSGITALDYVEPAEYKAIEVSASMSEIDDTYLDQYIQYMLSMNTSTKEIEGRDTVESGDIANIDYVGKKDGVAFDGGTAEGYDLTIGSGSFIDGFEDGLIGKKVGEEVTLDLTFPENYGNADLAGAAVTFDVKINSIKEAVTPELNDEYVASQNIPDVTTVEQYRDYTRGQLEEQAKATFDEEVQSQILQYLTDNSTVKQDLPAEMTERWNKNYTDMFTSYASQYGVDLATFMSMYGSTEDTYEADLKEMADAMAKNYVTLKAIAEKENITVTDKEFNTALTTQAAQAGYSSVKEYKEKGDPESYRDYLLVQKVMDMLTENAVVTAPEAAPAADTTAADTTAADTAAADTAETAAEEPAEADAAAEEKTAE